MIELDFSRPELRQLKPHQRDSVRAFVTKPAFALFDEPGAGKTYPTVAAANLMEEAGVIDTGIVVCPAAVRIGWRSPDFGEIAKWGWRPGAVHEYHAGSTRLRWRPGLNWVVTNYEFIREERRLGELLNQLGGRKSWVVLDESSRIKSHKAQQTKAAKKLRRACLRAAILNGSPIANNPLDLYSQFDFLDNAIIGCPNYWTFRARYAVMGGFKAKQVVGFRNIDELNRLIQPYLLRRLKRDCLDLPEKRFQARECRLSPETWRLYREMRDGMVAWLDDQPSIAPQAIVKILRLSQLTSGYLGGLVPQDLDPELAAGAPVHEPPREVSREKLDAFLDWFSDWLDAGNAEGGRLIVWGRFRLELDRAQAALEARGIRCVQVRGGQTKTQREDAIKAFTMERGGPAMVLFGSPHAGGLGLTLVEAHDVFYMSNDYSLIAREQSEDRAHRPGQLHDVDYVDLVACGPDGQKTIDHTVVGRLRSKRDLAAMTTAEWRKALTEE